MTYLEMLKAGVKAIAENHNVNCNVDELDTEGEVWLSSMNGMSMPTIFETKLMAEELKMSEESVEVHEDYGIDIYPDEEWTNEYANKEFVPVPTINGMWARYGQFPEVFNYNDDEE